MGDRTQFITLNTFMRGPDDAMKELIAPESGIVTAKQHETIKVAAQMMKQQKVGCLIVVNDHEEFAGLITESEIFLTGWPTATHQRKNH